MENWKDIKGYEGMYQISNCGRVKSLSRKVTIRGGGTRLTKDRILKPGLSHKGYLHCALCRESVHKTMMIHKMVAVAFLNHTPCGMSLVVDHIDFNKTNNNVGNLQLITNRDNLLKSSPKKYSGTEKTPAGRWRASIKHECKKENLGTYDTVEEAARAYQNRLLEININN